MKSLFLILPIAFIGLFACANAKKQAENSDQTDTKPPRQEVVEFATIKKTFCYGKCPVYEMTIYSDGKVVLNGKANIEMIGRWENKISEADLAAFVKMAEDINYMELDDKYDSAVTDLPSTTTSIVINGKRKEVYRRANYPERILKFEALFTELLEREGWTEKAE